MIFSCVCEEDHGRKKGVWWFSRLHTETPVPPSDSYLTLEILKTSLWLLPFFRKLDIHQTSPLITGGFFERLVGRVLLCGEVTGSSSKCCCGAVVSTWWTRHQNHRLLLGWRECGWLPQTEIRGSKGCGWWWWPGWVGGKLPTWNVFFFVWVEDLEDFIAKHLPSGKLTRQWKNGPVEDVFPDWTWGFSVANVSLLEGNRKYYLLLRQWLMMSGWRFQPPQPLTDGTKQGTFLLHCLGSTQQARSKQKMEM